MEYNWSTFSNAELARLIRNGAIVSGFDTDFNRAMIEETAHRLEAAEARVVELEHERDRAIFKFNDIGNTLDEARRQRDVLKEMYRDDHDERIRQAEKIKQLESEIAYLRSTDHAADIAFEHTAPLDWRETETPFGIALDGQGDEVES